MAINLNKGETEDAPSPSPSNSENKTINLSKSGDSKKINPNLSKEKVESTADSKPSSVDQNSGKKKSPIIPILLVVLLIGIGGFWFMNKKGGNDDVSSAATTNSTASSSDPAVSNQVEQSKPQSEPLSNIEKTAEVQSVNNNKTAENLTKSSPNTPNPSVAENKQSPSPQTKSDSSPSVKQLQGSIEEKARQVISGAFGNGADRKNALGNEYAAIQEKVNEMYRTEIK